MYASAMYQLGRIVGVLFLLVLGLLAARDVMVRRR